jgi:hypothetical protein
LTLIRSSPRVLASIRTGTAAHEASISAAWPRVAAHPHGGQGATTQLDVAAYELHPLAGAPDAQDLPLSVARPLPTAFMGLLTEPWRSGTTCRQEEGAWGRAGERPEVRTWAETRRIQMEKSVVSGITDSWFILTASPRSAHQRGWRGLPPFAAASQPPHQGEEAWVWGRMVEVEGHNCHRCRSCTLERRTAEGISPAVAARRRPSVACPLAPRTSRPRPQPRR